MGKVAIAALAAVIFVQYGLTSNVYYDEYSSQVCEKVVTKLPDH